ncbi:LytTR family DNA-binding domain-containing protein [Limibacter armeniacum]|uniref:LytR/AlgR family response regulator transcription factor n=1 Tax=Limibacter armeniacum TaxID=466084 RepID=UPI002FE626E6
MNCIIVDDEEVSRMIVRDFVERTPSLKLIAECDNAVEAFKIMKEEAIDIIFLDIEMPEMTGIELVQSLDSLPQVILITGRKDFGAEAYEYSLTDYLIKPINYPRFMKAVEKAQNNLQKDILDTQGNDDNIYVKADNRIVRIKLSDIYFIEALSDYVIINMESKKYIIHSTMKGLEQKLPSDMFTRVHRSYIVNLTKIDSIEDMSIVMPQKAIPIGNSYKSAFLSKLNFL